MPARRAVTNASPLGPRCSRSAASVSGLRRTVAKQPERGANEGSREQLEGDERADRIARQPDHGDALILTYGERFSRLHGDAPEVQAAGALEHLAHVVVLADAHTPGGEDEVA